MGTRPQIDRSRFKAVAVIAVLLTLTAALLGYCQRRAVLAKAPITRLDGLSNAQKEIVEVLGYPRSFILAYLPQAHDDSGRLVRFEVWFYPEHRKKITFLAGRIYDYSKAFGAGDNPDTLTYPELRPQDFDLSMSYKRAAKTIGSGVIPIEFADNVFAGSVRSYLAGQVIFSMDSGKLTYLQTLGAEKGEIAVDTTVFDSQSRPLNFIAKVPDRLTRPMGPIAPIGQAWLTGKQPVKTAEIAAKIQALTGAPGGGEQTVREVRRIYTDEAFGLRAEAEKLRADRRQLERRLDDTQTRDEYRKNVVDVSSLVGALEIAALNLDRAAAKLDEFKIARLFSGRAAASLQEVAEGLVVHDLGGELGVTTNAKKVTAFLRSGGIEPGRVIDKTLLDDAAAFLKPKKLESGPGLDHLKEQLAERLRERLLEDRGALRDRWRLELEEMYAELMPEPSTVAKKPARPKTRLTEWVDDLMIAVRGRPQAELKEAAAAPKSGTTNLRLKPSKGNSDKVELIQYKALIHVAEDGAVNAIYHIEYQLPGSGSNVLTFVQDAKLAPNMYASMYSSSWPRQISLGANMHVKSDENGRVFAEEDKVEENAMSGVLTSPTSGSGKISLTPSLSLDWETD